MWFYACLLLLCPSSFRHEYGREMTAIFARRLRDASPLAALFLWLEAISDVILAAAAAHAELLRHDVKYAVRSAARAKAFSATVIAVAALGVAAATAVFSIADHVLLRPLPFREPDRLVSLWEDQTSRGYSRNQASPPNFRDWKRMSTAFESMAAHRELSLNMSGAGEPERLTGAAATAQMFPALGVEPLLGRAFTAEEDRVGAPGVVVLSFSLWQRRFGGDRAVLGRRLQLDDEAFTIIGVMPAGFHFPRRETALWTAMRFGEEDYAERDNNFLGVIARLRPGVTLEQASAEMQVVAGALEKQYPSTNEKTGVRILRLRDELSWRSRSTLGVLSAAAFFLLLIACSNLANLLLAKSASRAKEMALRAALGAGRERLVRQLLTESALLAGMGGAIGTALSAVAVPLLSRLVPSSLPIAGTPAMDWRVLAFAFAVSLLTGMAFGVAPALRSTAGALGIRTAGGWRRQRLRRALVVTQVAASLALAISTGLLARALLRLENVPPGFATGNRLVFRTSLPMPKYLDTAPRERYYTRVLGELRSLPGVRAAGVTSFRPMGDFRGGIWGILLPGESRPRRAAARFVTPGYFSAMGIPLLRGRDIGEADSPRTLRVAVVSESFIREHWPGESGLGRTFAIPFGRMTFTIVGVAADVRFRGIEPVSEAQMYFAHAQTPDKSFVWFAPKDFAVSANGDPLALMPAIRRIVAAADPLQPVSDVQTLEGLVFDETAPRRVQLWVIGAFAAAAFLLAAIGIHGLLSFAVSQRIGEIGVRVALGASVLQIAGLVAAEAFALAGLGCVLGIAAACWAGWAMQAFLAGVGPADAATLAASVGLAVLMTVCGALAPVWRAVRVDPVIALRAE
jgi:predicted permease